MAIKLIGNYAKRLGLPGYSSHQFSVSVEIELSDAGNIQGEAARIYHLLQDAVDREIQDTGFVPGHDYGEVTLNHGPESQTRNGNGRSNGHHRANGSNGGEDRWSCSDKQKEFILKLVNENDLDRDTVEQTALDRFGVGVRQLNKLQASGFITELLESCGKNGKSPNGKGGRR
ncbi:MAG: hypothetical protein KDM63_00455 [Verrucomicrobiae bacterium]|nr:hypothetical protein [Verrucomicrobiae bacterium]